METARLPSLQQQQQQQRRRTPAAAATSLVILAVCAMTILALCVPQAVHGNTADQLWNKYRVRLTQLLQSKFPLYANGVKAFGGETNIANTVLHIVTDPVDAMWTSDIEKLAEFAGYVPEWSAAWSVRQTNDGTLAERYRQLLFSHRDKTLAANKFAQFSAAPMALEESPHHEKLAQFVSRTANLPHNAFHFIVEETSGLVSIGTPWGTHTSPFSHMTSIVRSLSKNGNSVMWDDISVAVEAEQLERDGGISSGADDTEDHEDDFDDEDLDYLLEEQEDEAELLSASQWLFGRRRRAPPPPPPPVPVVIKSKKFHMDMKARGLIGIPIRARFIDRQFLRQHRANFVGKWFGRGGEFALLPSIVWVAMRPRVVLRLSESEFQSVQSSWTAATSIGLAIANALFRNRNFQLVALEDRTALSSMFPQEVIDSMLRNNDLTDKATFTIKALGHGDDNDGEEEEEVILAEGALEDYDPSSLRSLDRLHQNNDGISISSNSGADDTEDREDDFDDEDLDYLLEEQEDEAELLSASQWLFGRRRRAPPPPPPPPPPVIKEKVFEATFSSESLFPQILAVTSDIL